MFSAILVVFNITAGADDDYTPPMTASGIDADRLIAKMSKEEAVKLCRFEREYFEVAPVASKIIHRGRCYVDGHLAAVKSGDYAECPATFQKCLIEHGQSPDMTYVSTLQTEITKECGNAGANWTCPLKVHDIEVCSMANFRSDVTFYKEASCDPQWYERYKKRQTPSICHRYFDKCPNYAYSF